jgi:hypothetical protein
MFQLVREFWLFLRVRKKWWSPHRDRAGARRSPDRLYQGSALAPFIYTLF